ncbi:hypothetical protein B296_00053830 [Ensete ventricosum]|uniref:Uncharacterized protein n=1 Tax=Ensete ventricosum TaxID=4639 RepID=A0A426Y6A5_ENSVE|nr:hypothetical protein B296_00053830 [Ensete ventricosum]
MPINEFQLASNTVALPRSPISVGKQPTSRLFERISSLSMAPDTTDVDLAVTSPRPRTVGSKTDILPLQEARCLTARTTEGVTKYDSMVSNRHTEDLRYRRLVALL